LYGDIEACNLIIILVYGAEDETQAEKNTSRDWINSNITFLV
jgi:hypothetical protein